MVLMPTTCPRSFSKAPPESPELMDASVWSSPVSVQLDPRPVSITEVRSVAEMMPVVTLGPPSRPSA